MLNQMLYFIQTQPSPDESPMAREVSRQEFFHEARAWKQAHFGAKVPLEVDCKTHETPALYLRLDREK